MFSFPAGCVGISLSFQEDPVNYCQQIYIFFILATLSTSKNHLGIPVAAQDGWTVTSTVKYLLSDLIWRPVCRSLFIIWSFYKNPSYIYFISSWNCCYWRLGGWSQNNEIEFSNWVIFSGVFISSLICLVQQLVICRRSGDRHFRKQFKHRLGLSYMTHVTWAPGILRALPRIHGPPWLASPLSWKHQG